MANKKYTFFSAGELENEIAGHWACQPLGVLMCYAERLADEFYDGVNDTVGPLMQDTVDEFKSLLCLAKLVPINIKLSLTIGGETIGVKP